MEAAFLFGSAAQPAAMGFKHSTNLLPQVRVGLQVLPAQGPCLGGQRLADSVGVKERNAAGHQAEVRAKVGGDFPLPDRPPRRFRCDAQVQVDAMSALVANGSGTVLNDEDVQVAGRRTQLSAGG